MYACRYQNSLGIVNALIEKGAYIRTRNKYNATPLLMAADYSQNPEIIKVLMNGRSSSDDEVFKAFILAITGNSVSEHVRLAKISIFIESSAQQILERNDTFDVCGSVLLINKSNQASHGFRSKGFPF